MSKQRFPHLQNTTSFPGNNGQPYSQYPNDFNYERWGVGTKLTVCRVPWDLDSNVVDWGSSDAIVNYFHNLDSSSSFKLESELNREPDGSIRLPIPISNIKKYNYLFVEYTVPTTAEQPLDYADGTRQPFIGFFMSDFSYVAPNTTEAALATDWWTTSITSMEIQNMMLERGHAPMAAVRVDDYLKDPLHNNRYLLTSDVSYGEPCITTSAQFESWMATTEPLMVLAVKATLEQAQAMLAEKQVGGKNTPPTFADTQDRWGKQYQVNDYSWAGVSPFKDASVESTPWSTATGLPAGVSMIAVKATEANTFLEYMQTNSPELFEVTQSCFLIPGSLVASKEAGTYGGVQLFELKPLEELPPVPVKLEKEDFDYPEEYSKIAKLYTYPYAGLTFSDNNGHSTDVRIEYTSSVQIHRRVSIAYPYLRAQAFLSGVNGEGTTSYEWVDACGLKRSGSMPQADWRQTLLEYDIPTYALAQTAISQALLKNSTPAAIERIKALTAYQNGTRSLNTNTENTRDSLATSLKNALRSNETALENGTRSNETSNTNAIASLTTGNTNTLASNKLALDNGSRSNETSNTNTLASIGNSFTTTKNSITLAKDNGGRSNTTGYKNAVASATTANVNSQASALTAKTNTEASAGTAYQNAENSAGTAYQNTKNSADTGLANTLASNATAKANGDRSNNTSTANTLAAASTGLTNANRSADAARTAVTNSVANANDTTNRQIKYNDDSNLQLQKYSNKSFTNKMSKLTETIGDPSGKLDPNAIKKMMPAFTYSNLGEFVSALENAAFWGKDDEITSLFNQTHIEYDEVLKHATTNDLIYLQNVQNTALPTYLSGRQRNQNVQDTLFSMATGMLSMAGAAESIAVSNAKLAAKGDALSGSQEAVQLAMPAVSGIHENIETSTAVSSQQATTFISAAVNQAKTNLAITDNARKIRISKEQDRKQLNTDIENTVANKNLANSLSTDLTNLSNGLASKNADLAQATSKANAASLNATTVANANRSSETTSANLAATKTTADANANSSYNTTMTNAENSKNTSLTNAGNTKGVTLENNTRSFDTARDNANRSYENATKNAKLSYDTTTTNIQASYDTANTNNALNRKTSTENQGRSYNTAKANMAASKSVADANANRSFNTGTENQGRSYTTTSNNLEASKTTADANANRSYTTAVANAGYSQDSGLMNSQAELKLKQEAYQMSIENARTNAPLTVGSTTGDPLPDLWGQRGVEIRVNTQPLGAIASAGSEMLRYGYQLGQAWKFSGWSVMKHFSYWKASDLWLTPKSAFAELGKAAIRGIIESGVTVWRKPEEIGTVAVTENWED